MKYYNINGTEGNAVLTDIGRVPDTEDLNRNDFLDQTNSYYRYEIPLDTNSTQNKFVIDGGFNPDYKWYLYRIPLRDFSKTIGNPSFENIDGIRIFVQGVDSAVHFQITEFNLVGNQWQKNLPDSIAKPNSAFSFCSKSEEKLIIGSSRSFSGKR
jgi:cell surface protein SprA